MSSSACATVELATFPGVAPAAGLNHTRGAGYEASKRAIDLAGSAALLAVCLPVLVLIAGLIKLESPGPVIFRQRRLGRGGREFVCLKFRTMVHGAEARLAESRDLSARFVENFKLKGDPRVTRFGAVLRRSSLDELPQLWNVLLGEMSLIGPRPIVEPERVKYGIYAARLLAVRPGLGGSWQVNGRSDTTYPERVAMDLGYIDSRSIGLDLVLLVRTAVVVIRGRGAY